MGTLNPTHSLTHSEDCQPRRGFVSAARLHRKPPPAAVLGEANVSEQKFTAARRPNESWPLLYTAVGILTDVYSSSSRRVALSSSDVESRGDL